MGRNMPLYDEYRPQYLRFHGDKDSEYSLLVCYDITKSVGTKLFGETRYLYPLVTY
jgi:hypothetical protein